METEQTSTQRAGDISPSPRSVGWPVVVIGLSLGIGGVPGTATARPPLVSYVEFGSSTSLPSAISSNVPLRPNTSGVKRLKDATGATWDQLGRLFGVSRRALHAWANAAPMNSQHAERLEELLALVTGLAKRGDVHTHFFTPGPDGRSLYSKQTKVGSRTKPRVGPSAIELISTTDGSSLPSPFKGRLENESLDWLEA